MPNNNFFTGSPSRHLDLYHDLNFYFDQVFQNLDCNDYLKSYLISIFSKYKSSNYDLSDESITLLYSRARTNQDFLTFQTIGDWLFFCQTIFPEYLNNASPEYFQSLARLSYYSCFKLINKQCKFYEQLADDFVPLVNNTRQLIINQ